MNEKEPLLLYIDDKYRNKENSLLHSPDSIFTRLGNKLGNKDLFMLALMTGFKENIRYEIKKRADFDLRTAYLNNNEKALIKVIAIKTTGDLNIISSPVKYYSIAEEYVNGGIEILYDSMLGKNYDSYIKNLENELRQVP